MAKQTFVADTILTAAQMNALQGNDYNQTVSNKVVSYTLVAADAGTKIVMNSASATTITVNTSLFSAGDTLTILNIGAGVSTITAGTATVSTTGSLALAQYGGGTLYFTSAGVSVFQANGVTATAGGLVFITSASFIAQTSASFVTNTFSATYANYKVLLTITSSSVNGANIQARLRAAGTDNTTSNYNIGGLARTFAGATATQESASGDSFYFFDSGSTDGAYISMDIFGPQLTQTTAINSQTTKQTAGCFNGNMFKATTSFDAMTFFPTTGTMTGNYKVYGYTNS